MFKTWTSLSLYHFYGIYTSHKNTLLLHFLRHIATEEPQRHPALVLLFVLFPFFFFFNVCIQACEWTYATTHTLWGSPHEESLHSHWSPWLPDFCCIRLRASQHSARSWRRLSSKARAAQLLVLQEVNLHCTCQRAFAEKFSCGLVYFTQDCFVFINAKNLFSLCS